MAKDEEGVLYNIRHLLQQDYRGVNIAVYAVATAGLAYAIQKVRPVSKFSKATKVPSHFIRDHVPLQGVCAGVQHSPVRVLINHRAPIYLPLWHSSKPPLPVKIWGVEVASGNAISWLDCVARGRKVTLQPLGKENNDLISTVSLHLPQPKAKSTETLDVGKKLVELGFAQASIPNNLQKKSVESQLAPAIISAEARAKSLRNGIWSDKLPPIPFYVVYYRKAIKLIQEIAILTSKQLYYVIMLIMRSALSGSKTLLLMPFKKPVKT